MRRSIALALASLLAKSPYVYIMSRKIRAANLTFVSRKKLRRLAKAILTARLLAPRGVYIETGVALGGTAILIAKLKPRNQSLRLYDVFGLIPPPSEKDSNDARSRYDVIASGQAQGIGGKTYYGYRDDLKSEVESNLRRFDVNLSSDKIELVQGVFEETLHPASPVAFAHVDCDWYDSVMVCIERIWPQMSVGGVIVFDDYRSYEGCKKAVDEFLAATPDYQIIFSDVSLGIVKTDAKF